MQADRKTNIWTKNRQGKTQKRDKWADKHRARKKGTVEKERK